MKRWLLVMIGAICLGCSATAQAPTDPPAVVATATPGTAAFCAALVTLLQKEAVASDFANSHFSNVPVNAVFDADLQSYRDLLRAANAVPIPLPPGAADSDARKLYEALRLYQAAADRIESGLSTKSLAAVTQGQNDKAAAGRDVTAYRAVVCQ